jgi:hypothetical protein
MARLFFASCLALSLACAGGRDGEAEEDTAGGDTDGGDTDGGDTDVEPIDHPACDAYVACVADVTPEAAASAVEEYGDGSVCWDDADSVAICEAACAAAMTEAHLNHPASAACDDGTPVPSDRVFQSESWVMGVTGSTGELCADIGGLPSFRLELETNGTTAFTGDMSFDYVFAYTFPLTCDNDGLDVTCTHSDDDLGLDGTFTARIDDDLLRVAGTFTLGFRAATCAWDIDSDADPDEDAVYDLRADADGDGLSNYSDELGPFDPDSDDDGLDDGEEYALGTDLYDDDSDGDGATDGDELAAGTDPLDPSSRP